MSNHPHFTLDELCHSSTAIRKGINNIPDAAEVLANLEQLMSFLEQIRGLFGDRAIIINSGYRCLSLNQAIGGSKASQHMKGQAADFIVDGIRIDKVYDTIKKSGLAYDQLIFEFGVWIHVSISEEPRHQNLLATKQGTKTIYKED